jgi:hypothetical protein
MPPPRCAHALKEWAGVVAALESGQQILLLRKGGIAEPEGSLSVEHPWFWIYPTHSHEATQGLRPGIEPAAPHGADFGSGISLLAQLVGKLRLADFAVVEALSDWHGWTAETIEKRYRYRSPGLWMLVLRVWRRRSPVEPPMDPAHVGCQSWVMFDPPLAVGECQPVVPTVEFDARVERLREIIARQGAVLDG